jgi:hypothetical protein
VLALALVLGAGCSKDSGKRFPEPSPEPPVENPPVISSLSPAAGPLAGGNTVTISGSHFTAGTSVFFDQRAATAVAVESEQRLRAVVPQADQPGLVDVTVRNANGEDTLPDGYEYLGTVLPLPEITSLDPIVGPLAGGNTVSVAGDNFMEEVEVFFGAEPAASVTFVSVQALTVVPPPGDATGLVDVTVRTVVGEFVAAAAYRYALPDPRSVTPDRGPRAGGTQITINGLWFTTPGDTTMLLGANEANVLSVTPTAIVALTPPAAQDGLVALTVTNSFGTGVLEDAFLYEHRWGRRSFPASSPTADRSEAGPRW